MSHTLQELFPKMPEKFLANRLDELSDSIFRWRTVKNLRCKGTIPESCFVKISPRKILIVRDEFLAWALKNSSLR